MALIFSGAVIFGPGAALAEDAKPVVEKVKVPDFVPFVVDQVQMKAAQDYLNGLTFKDAAPLWNWLTEQEARAKGQWEADHQPKQP